MNVLLNILSRMLPKTGQFSDYRAGDDGDLQKGWWKNRTLANNRVRFIDNGNGTITDRATKLMWTKYTVDDDAKWNTAIDNANNLDLAGFTDWRLPNVFELFSIADFSISYTSINPILFPDIAADLYWTSTTYAGNTAYAFVLQTYDGVTKRYAKSSYLYMLCCRTI